MYASQEVCKAPVAAPATTLWNNIAGRSLREQVLRPHETLFLEGNDAEFLYGVMEGVLCNYRILSDGRRQVMSFPYPGDLIGLGHSAAYHFACEAVCGARVRSIRKSALLHDAEGRAEIEHRLLEFANVELASMQEHHLLLGRKTALEKVASFLLMLTRKSVGDHTQGSHFRIPMTRKDIADFLGLTIETVSRNMSKLRVKGVIDLPQATTIAVLDIQLLKTLAEEEKGAF